MNQINKKISQQILIESYLLRGKQLDFFFVIEYNAGKINNAF